MIDYEHQTDMAGFNEARALSTGKSPTSTPPQPTTRRFNEARALSTGKIDRPHHRRPLTIASMRPAH